MSQPCNDAVKSQQGGPVSDHTNKPESESMTGAAWTVVILQATKGTESTHKNGDADRDKRRNKKKDRKGSDIKGNS